jgi:uncharacterized lipoprotein YmbA
MKKYTAILLVMLGACGAPQQQEESTLTYSQPIHQSNVVKQKDAYTDPDGLIATWKATVIDRADSATLQKIKTEVEARLREDKARDIELSCNAPGVVVESRIGLSTRLAYDKACLDVVNARIAGR